MHQLIAYAATSKMFRHEAAEAPHEDPSFNPNRATYPSTHPHRDKVMASLDRAR